MNLFCKNCGHPFKVHQLATFGLWYCDFEDLCPCNNFEQTHEVRSVNAQYGSDSYRWN